MCETEFCSEEIEERRLSFSPSVPRRSADRSHLACSETPGAELSRAVHGAEGGRGARVSCSVPGAFVTGVQIEWSKTLSVETLPFLGT